MLRIILYCKYLELIRFPHMERKMGYVMSGLTVAVSILSFQFFLRFFTSRSHRFKRSVDVADLSMNEADVVGFLLPRAIRRVWNFLVLAVAIVFLGVPHYLVIFNFWRQREIDAWLYVHYSWTLIYWIALLALYALVLANHRRSRSRQEPANR